MKRILVSAYAVSPDRGSECAVGWEITKRLGRYFDVTVIMCEITPSDNHYYGEIKQYFQKMGKIENLLFVPVSMPKKSKFYTLLHDIGFWPAYYWGYNCWQKSAFKRAQKLHKERKFDLVYQLNMIGFREPGYLWKLDVPFIWGPINGFHSIPFSFIRYFKGKEFLMQSLKHVTNELQIRISNRARRAAEEAKIVWCVDQRTMNQMVHWNANAELMQETGLVTIPHYLQSNRNYDGVRCLNLVWSGMITTGKALNILIQALIELKNYNFHLTVIGDGPLLDNLKKFSAPVQTKITWTGWISKSEAIKLVGKCDLLIHTSLKEGTPHSILEALGMGIPVICHDTCGMGAVINQMNGFKIPYVDVNTSVEFIVNLLVKLINNPTILNDRYKTILNTITQLSWDSKVDIIAKKINQILN